MAPPPNAGAAPKAGAPPNAGDPPKPGAEGDAAPNAGGLPNEGAAPKPPVLAGVVAAVDAPTNEKPKKNVKKH